MAGGGYEGYVYTPTPYLAFTRDSYFSDLPGLSQLVQPTSEGGRGVRVHPVPPPTALALNIFHASSPALLLQRVTTLSAVYLDGDTSGHKPVGGVVEEVSDVSPELCPARFTSQLACRFQMFAN